MILGIDDSPHLKGELHHYRPSPMLSDKINQVNLVGAICKGLQLIYTAKEPIEVDGTDSTEAILRLYRNSPFQNQIRMIMINSPTVGGFNIVNPFRINEITQLPIILLSDRKPQSNIAEIYARVFPERKEQIEVLRRLPPIEELKVNLISDSNCSGMIYFHCIGIPKSEILPVLRSLSYYSALSEPLRLAHTIATMFNVEKEEAQPKEE